MFRSQNVQRQLIILVIFVRPAENSHGFDAFIEVSRLLKAFVFVFPGSEFLILYQSLQLLHSNDILLSSSSLDLVIDEIEPIHLFFELLKSKDNGSDKYGSS